MYFRKKINTFLSWLFSRTNAHARINDHGLSIVSDKPKPKHWRAIYLNLRWFSVDNDLSFRWRIAHDAEDTFQLFISFPWVLEFLLSFDIGYRNWIKKIVGEYRAAGYGFEANRAFAAFEWRQDDMDSDYGKGKRWQFDWNAIHGKPKRTITAFDPIQTGFTQPASFGYAQSEHVAMLIYSVSITRWPRFWKRDVVVEGFDVKVDNPPAAPNQDDTYAMFFRVKDNDEAIQAYIAAIEKNRNVTIPAFM